MSSDKHPTAEPIDNNPKTLAGMQKPPLGLVPKAALEACAAALKFGADKYGAWNWRDERITASVYVDAIGRHWADYKEGKNVAADSQISQLAHIMATCAILIDAEANGVLNDDRPKPGRGFKVFNEFADIERHFAQQEIVLPVGAAYPAKDCGTCLHSNSGPNSRCAACLRSQVYSGWVPRHAPGT